MKRLNKRWQRNLHNIKAIEKDITQFEEDKKVIEDSNELTKMEIKIEDLHTEIENLKKSFEELILEIKRDLKKLYLNKDDERPWAIAWSGGKDSTTVLGLVVDMLQELKPEERKRHVYVIMSDTVVENPNLEEYMHSQVDKFHEFIMNTDLPISAEIVKRPLKNSYFYLILGRGYFLPQNNGAGRWCTDRLKLKPQNEKLLEINPSFILIGVRLSESAKRKASIKKWSDNDDLNKKIGDHVHIKSSNTFMPIVDFTIEDVWEYLQRERLAWSSTHDVRKLYRDATGECGFTNPKGTEAKASQSESCGARFGCWTCPVILKDRSTEEMSKSNQWMTPLTNYRMMQLKVMGDYKPFKPKGQNRKARSHVLKQVAAVNEQIKFITKSGHKRNGKLYTDKYGVIHKNKGTVTVEAREFLYEELIHTEIEVNRLRQLEGLPVLKLISDEECEAIKEMWERDRNECPWLITNVNGLVIDRLKELLDQIQEIEDKQPLTI